MKWWILWLFLLQKVNFAPTYIISVKMQKKYIKQFAYFDNSLYLCIVIKKQMLLIKKVRHTLKTGNNDKERNFKTMA